MALGTNAPAKRIAARLITQLLAESGLRWFAHPLTRAFGSHLSNQDLIDRVNQFAFAGSLSGTVPAPACKKQGPFTFGGETTQYPHVKAGTGR